MDGENLFDSILNQVHKETHKILEYFITMFIEKITITVRIRKRKASAFCLANSNKRLYVWLNCSRIFALTGKSVLLTLIAVNTFRK